jgi:CelD/BcsL family acetyltransferase involved in cellulose biosynthesis
LTSINVDLVGADRLSPAEIAIWSQLQSADSALDSPFFRPEFTLAVAAVRHDVEVAILRDGSEPVGFFPYQRQTRRIARPVGGHLSDFQGLIARKGLAVDPQHILAACGLTAWQFDNLPASQESFAPYQCVGSDSPYLDLRGGFAAYRQEKEQGGSGTIAQIERTRRKLERDVGPVRLVPHATERRLFDLLLEWKVEQYRRLQVPNCLAASWTVALLDRIRHIDEPAFAGLLSVLYAGERPVALHLGMRAHGVLHAWFPTYDRDFAKYSPGLMFWVEIARNAKELGIYRIDLGKGQEQYKVRLQSGVTRVTEGSVDRRRVAASLRRGWLYTRDFLRATPLRGPGRAVLRYARNWFARPAS